MKIFRRFKDYLRLREAIKMADNAHASLSVRHYVLGYAPAKRKPSLLIVDRSNFRTLKRKGYIDGGIQMGDLVRESFYFTPHRNGTGMLCHEEQEAKLRNYYKWCEAIRSQN